MCLNCEREGVRLCYLKNQICNYASLTLTALMTLTALTTSLTLTIFSGLKCLCRESRLENQDLHLTGRGCSNRVE